MDNIEITVFDEIKDYKEKYTFLILDNGYLQF